MSQQCGMEPSHSPLQGPMLVSHCSLRASLADRKPPPTSQCCWEDDIETSNERSSLKEEGRGREKRMHNAKSSPPGVINTPATKEILHSVSTDAHRSRNDEIHPAVLRCLSAEVLKQQTANENVPEIHVENPCLNTNEREGRIPPTGQE